MVGRREPPGRRGRLKETAEDARREPADLAPAFLAGLGRRRGSAADAMWLERTLETTLGPAMATWPTLSLPATDFARFVGARLPPGEDVAAALASMPLADLYLTFACAAGRSDAIALLERRHKRDIDTAMARLRRGDPRRDEAMQLLRERLFVTAGGRPPRIAEYGGRTPLGRWLRTVALRVVLNLVRGAPREQRLDDADRFLALPVARDDPQLDYFKATYHAEFARAFREALRSMEPEPRRLLRRYHVEGLELADLGAIAGVHAATVSRRLSRARRELVDETRRRLRRELGVAPGELDSVLRLLDSRLDLAELARTRGRG